MMRDSSDLYATSRRTPKTRCTDPDGRVRMRAAGEPDVAETSILIVDDDSDILTAARLLLKRHFGKVITANQPSASASRLRQSLTTAVRGRRGPFHTSWHCRERTIVEPFAPRPAYG